MKNTVHIMSDVHISQHIETHNTLPFVINVNCFLFKMLQTEVVSALTNHAKLLSP